MAAVHGWRLEYLAGLLLRHTEFLPFRRSVALSIPQGTPPANAANISCLKHGSSYQHSAASCLYRREVAKARILTLWSYSGKQAVSTVVVDKTVQAIVVLIWGITGTIMLAMLVNEPAIVNGAIIGAALLFLGILGFIFIQHSGSMSFLARFGAKIGGMEKWGGIVDDAGEVDKSIREIYQRPVSVLAACGMRLAIRIILVGEVVLAGHLLGFPIGFGEALMLKSW